ncbi:MAG: hypothetical protein HY584_03020 [Candidatus Omnitrophica bacterium]|nr:hypothetical protein [Candidatus Omnitrophota bacterium]
MKKRLEIKQQKHFGCLGPETGMALVSSLGMITTIATLTVGFLASGLIEIQAARNFEARMTAFHLAEGAVDQTIVMLRSDPTYAGLASTDSSNSRIAGKYQTTVTRSETNPEIYTIKANGSVSQNGSSSGGGQQRNITAVVEIGLPIIRNHALYADQTIQMSGNIVSDSYDSNKGPYQQAFAGKKGHIGSNRSAGNTISLSGNAIIKGNASIGPNGDVERGIITSGTSAILGTKYAAPEKQPLDPVRLTRGIQKTASINIAGSETITLPGGTYYYKQLSISDNAQLILSGETTIYTTGDVNFHGNGIKTAENRPPNLTINVAGNRTVSIKGSGNFYGKIYAPQSTISIDSGTGKKKLELFGSFTGNYFMNSGNVGLHYDEALSQTLIDENFSDQMKSWQEQ